jgi:putative ABC transport system permease protein
MSGAATASSGPRPVRSLTAVARRLAAAWWPQVAALAAACGVVATTIGGAIGVGDALETGLRRLAVSRLGRIDAAVIAEDFVTPRLLDESAGDGPRLVPAIVMEVSVDVPGGAGGSRATLLACDDPAALGFSPPPPPLDADGVLVNEPLAAASGATAAGAIVLRIPRRSAVPADSPLGRRTADSASRRLQVRAVLPGSAAGLGQFSLRPVQATGPLVIASLATARDMLRRDDAVNVVFAAGDGAAGGADAAAWLTSRLRPGLADDGLALAVPPAKPGTAPSRAARLTSRRLLLPSAVDEAAAAVLRPAGGRPSLAFLANAITPVSTDAAKPASIPYSTVLGIDDTRLPVGDLVAADGRPLPVPQDDEVLIDRWTAEDLAAQGRPVEVGDRIRLTFFLPESVHGRVEESAAEFRIAGIAEMQGAAVARELVPDVEGITDEKSIADWDPPFPFDPARVRTSPPHDEDDRYWKLYGTTPKAFISLAAARLLAGSRFGRSTAWHLPELPDERLEELRRSLAEAIRPEDVGIRVVPLRRQALEAARGSTPFGGLFLALSSFVVVSGLLLEWLLFNLLVAARRRDIGVLAAIGWRPARLAAVLTAVGLGAAVVGVAAGTAAGPAWAAVLLRVLGSSWSRDVAAGSADVFTMATPAWGSLLPAAAAAVGMSVVALWSAARRAARQPPLALLRGGEPRQSSSGRRRHRGAVVVATLALPLAAAAVLAGVFAPPQAAVGLFFAAGFAALAGMLAVVRLWLGRSAIENSPGRPVRSLVQLAGRGFADRPGRSFSVAAIVASAEFLLVAVSAFAVRPPDDLEDRQSPTGGWTMIASFGEPTSVDPADAATIETLGLSAAEQAAVGRCEIARLRSSVGDDASCTNLYATLTPTVLGVGPGFVSRGGFRFVARAGGGEAENPWLLLGRRSPEQPIPAVLDQATAQWGLKLGGVGARFRLPVEAGGSAEFEIVGLLEPGILQGFVLIAERDFEAVFPSRSGYGMAVVDTSRLELRELPVVRAALTKAWAEASLSLTPAADRLRNLLAVQNTFLSGFQALGSLGLLLGTAGVAAVQLQGMAERRGQLAVLRAIGFTLSRVRTLLALETLVTVGLGVAAGALAGLLAVVPAIASGNARVPLAWIAVTGGLTLLTAVAASLLVSSRRTIPERPGLE